jgi:hypothetical protein
MIYKLIEDMTYDLASVWIFEYILFDIVFQKMRSEAEVENKIRK